MSDPSPPSRHGRPFATFDRVVESALDSFVVFFGLWTLYCNVLVFSGASFHVLLALGLVPVALSCGLVIWLRRADSPVVPRSAAARDARIPLALKLAVAAGLVAVHAWTGRWVLFWGLASVFVVGCVLDQPRRTERDEPPGRRAHRFEVVVLIATIVAALVFTALIHRSDADDAFYMSVPVALLDHPDRPVLQEDTMHGEEGFPLLGPFYRLVSYEVLVAALAWVTGLDHRILYYLFFPLVFAVMVVVANWLPIRLTSPRTASLGVVLVVLVLVAWGDAHHTYGNFGLVRIFQGKAVLVSVCAPAILYYGMRYSARGDRSSWVRLGLAQVTMMGFSASGVVIAPLLAGLVLLGGWRPDRRSTRIFVLGLLASLVVVLEGGVILRQVREFGAFVSPLESGSTVSALAMVLGRGWRSSLALFGFLGAVAASRSTPAQRGTAGYLTAAFLLLLNPWAGELITRAEPTFAWRALWAVPFPLILGWMVARLAGGGPPVAGMRLGAIGALVFALAFALSPGRWTSAEANRARLRLAAFRVGEGWPAAERVVEVTPPDGLVLAPRRVAIWITGIRGHPRLVGVRQDYLDIVVGKALGAEEAARRRTLMDFVQGRRSANLAGSVADEIVRRGVDTVVTHPDLAGRRGEPFFDDLARRGFEREEAGNGYLIWTRSGRPGD